MAEYIVIAAGIAVAIVVAVLFLGGTFSALWDRSSTPVTQNTFTPPDVTPFSEPKTTDDCDGDKWEDYPDLGFKDSTDCVDYVKNKTSP